MLSVAQGKHVRELRRLMLHWWIPAVGLIFPLGR